MVGKLYAIADLHLSYPANKEALSAIQDVHQDDGLILAGDLGEKVEHLRTVFSWAISHFNTVWWCPGNHELYTIPSEKHERSSKSRGVAKYELCVEIARGFGVKTPEDEFEVWEYEESASGEGDGEEKETRKTAAVVCPIFTLYDYSFRPDDVPREKALEWALEKDIQATDEFLLHSFPYETRDAWCEVLVKKFEAKLQQACEKYPDLPLIIANHWPLNEKVLLLPKIPRFSLWCGTRKTADWHTRFRAKVVVSGHLHIRRTDWNVDGVRFEECSMGYPRQWEDAQKMGRDINNFLREILPGRGQDPGDGKPIWRPYG